MKQKGCSKDFELELAGALDARSPSGRVSFNDFRLILNMDGSEQRGYCRLGGWQPYLKDSELGFKNQDLHDQMTGGQYYHRSYTYSYNSSQYISGYSYSIFYPGFYVDDYDIAGPQMGPFCGYAMDLPYLFAETANDYNISSWFAGAPYNYILDADCVGDGGGGPGTPPNAGDWTTWEVRVRSTPFTLSHTHFVAAEVSWDSALFGHGDVTKVSYENGTPQTHVLTFCLPPDATNVTLVGWGGGLVSGPTHIGTACGASVAAMGGVSAGDPCVDENCYKGSYYFLTYTFHYDGYEVPAYHAGALLPIYTTTGSDQDVDLCYPQMYYVPNICRESITALYPMNSVGGRRRLVAATRSRIYVNDDRNGNWRILADGLGGGCTMPDDCTCSNKRFRIAALGNTMLFTNGVDPVLAWDFDSGPEGCFFWSADYVAQLRALFIDTAEVVQSWNGFAFIANVSENGDRFAARVYWSDYNDGLSWIPGGESLAGYHDFGNGEKVLSMEPIGGRLRIFTDKAIYDCVLVRDPEQVFSFQEIYRGPNVLRYEFAIVNTGDSLIWLGESSIYIMSEYDRTPQRIEWIHLASGVVYNGIRAEWVQSFPDLPAFGPINKERCKQAVGGWDSERQAIWFSWPTQGHDCPNMTLILWPRYFKASIVDHGFTAFVNHRPDYRQSIRDFLWTHNFCESSQLMLDKEGLPYTSGGSQGYQFLFNSHESTAYPMDPNSAIGSLCGICLHDICESCDVDVRFLMASATDKTIKEFTPSQCVREMLGESTTVTFPETSTATYLDTGYTSMLQSDMYDFNSPVEKTLTAINIDYVAALQTTPNDLFCQVAFGAQPECTSWQDSDPSPLECLDGPDYDPETNMRPGQAGRFAFHVVGVYVAWRLYTSGVGGGACFASLTMSLRKKSDCW